MIVKALVGGLLLVALIGSAPLWLKKEREPLAAPIGASLLAFLQKDVEGFASAQAPWRFSFPADHGSHPAYRTESWHFSGTLAAAQGRRFGFRLTFLRIGVNPPGTALGPSAWATRDLYWGHFSLTDAAGERFYAFERFARDAMGQSGAQRSPVRVWLEDWSMEAGGGDGDSATFRLRAVQDGVAIELALRSAKRAVVPPAGDAPGFHAYLMTRLAAKGSIEIDGRFFEVDGDAWLDRAWGRVPLPLGAVVWDRFLLQLDDGRELMALRLRRRDGSSEPVPSGLLVEHDGAARTLGENALTIDVLEHWSSPHGGTRYPTRWRLRLPGEAMELYLAPYVASQELRLSLRSWAGAVRVTGTANGRAIAGQGQMELAGYGETARVR